MIQMAIWKLIWGHTSITIGFILIAVGRMSLSIARWRTTSPMWLGQAAMVILAHKALLMLDTSILPPILMYLLPPPPPLGYDVAEWVVNGIVCQMGGTNFNASGSYQVHVVFRPANPKLTLGSDHSISFMSHTNISYQISWNTNLCASNWLMTGFTNWTGTGSNQTHALPSNGLSPCFIA